MTSSRSVDELMNVYDINVAGRLEVMFERLEGLDTMAFVVVRIRNICNAR